MFIMDKTSETTSLITVNCCMCGQKYSFTVSTAGIEKWILGELIQKALPEVSKANRELLTSSTCGECFDAIYTAEEE